MAVVSFQKMLISETEIEKIKGEVSSKQFKTNKKNVAFWCLQYCWFFIGLTQLLLLLTTNSQLNQQNLFMPIGAFFVALANHIQWKRYKEQYVMSTLLKKYNEEN